MLKFADAHITPRIDNTDIFTKTDLPLAICDSVSDHRIIG